MTWLRVIRNSMICCTEEDTDSALEATVHHMRMLTLTETNAIKIENE